MSEALDLMMLGYCDLGAIFRGRLLPSADLTEDGHATVGWVPSTLARPPFGRSVRPNLFGAIGDLRLRPDLATRTRIQEDSNWTASEFVVCDLVEPEGRTWECCPRECLRRVLATLKEELGARLFASFEHEFQLQLKRPASAVMSLEAHRALAPFASQSMGALRRAGLEPEQFIHEAGTHQYEIPIAASYGLTSADRAVMFREIVREIARRNGTRATFTPIQDIEGQGNGAHIHFSLRSETGEYLFYDPEQPWYLSELGASFAAGILEHASALSALTAPSPISHLRVQPGRRSAGTVSLGYRNRETLLRIPPLLTGTTRDLASQMRLEYRGADATANPYLALAALIHAGLAGVREQLPAPDTLSRDPDQLSNDESHRYRVGALPTSLEQSLAAISADETIQRCMTQPLYETYMAVKQAEVTATAEQEPAEICARYASIY